MGIAPGAPDFQPPRLSGSRLKRLAQISQVDFAAVARLGPRRGLGRGGGLVGGCFGGKVGLRYTGSQRRRRHGRPRQWAAGGTHLYSAAESVGAIGNVYTRRSHRGHGYAAAVVAAIVERLIERGTETIGLNVRAANTGAIRLYQRLGFTIHTRFFEGHAMQRKASSSRL